MKVEPAQSEETLQFLKKRLSGEVFLDDYQRALYSTDASIYQIQPLGVVIPRTVDDVVCAMQVAAECNVSIVPRGGGTSLSGQAIGAGLILDFSKYLNRILEIDPQSRTARVQAGVVLDALNTACAPHALQFGPDVATSSRANLGGMIGNNSAGARSVCYGKTVDHVLELDVVLADGNSATLAPRALDPLRAPSAHSDRMAGICRELKRIVAANRDEIIARFPPLLRRVSGYNLDEFVPECCARVAAPLAASEIRRREQELYPDAPFNLSKLIVGSEGTLATVTAARVQLVPLPAARGVLVLHFDSLAHAVQSVGPILASHPSAVELMDGLILRLAEQSLEYRRYLDFVVGRPKSLMLVELTGDSASEVEAKADALNASLRGQPGLTHVLPALERSLYGRVWACRKASLPLLLGVPGARKPVAFVEDTAVEPARLPEFVARFEELMDRHGTVGAFYGHASVGCLHIRPMLDLTDPLDLDHLAAISREVCEMVLEFHGAMSGEHGDGLSRSYLNERLFGPRLYRAFQEVKAAFDPENRMNPGKIVNGPSPVRDLRLGANYHPLNVATTFDFSREGGLAAAAELCNGSAVCRKMQSGTMCPSFMGTCDEEHSTRGRANALRLVLSGVLPPQELTGSRLFQTYDLCLQCKGCKAECPSNVDVAKLKAEFLDGYYRRHGASLGVLAVAHAAYVNRAGAALAPLSNWAARLPGAAWIAEKLLGLDRRRPLPRFERDHFRRWFARRQRSKEDLRGNRPVVLLDDCLTSYCETSVNRAAVQLLEAAGFQVHLAGLECCGRTLVSKGFLTEAQQLARRNLERLLPWALRGVPIVGCEPSCLLMFVDEYVDLLPGNASRRLASQAMLIDSFLARSGIKLPLQERAGEILLHGHCHQKALVGMHDARAALAMIPGAAIEVLDSGCCGMAGSFGYEHYELSMKIGQRVLFPAVRAKPQAAVAAPGFSCRQQILHGTGRPARHPVELLAECLVDETRVGRDHEDPMATK